MFRKIASVLALFLVGCFLVSTAGAAPRRHTHSRESEEREIRFSIRDANTQTKLSDRDALDYLREHPWLGTSDPNRKGSLEDLKGLTLGVTGTVKSSDRVSIILVTDDGSEDGITFYIEKNIPIESSRSEYKIDDFWAFLKKAINGIPNHTRGNPHDGKFYLQIKHRNEEPEKLFLFKADWNEDYKVTF